MSHVLYQSKTKQAIYLGSPQSSFLSNDWPQCFLPAPRWKENTAERWWSLGQ